MKSIFCGADSTKCTTGQYSVFRACLGAYLTVHFLQLLPYGAELFSNRGLLPEADWSPLVHLFPNFLALADTPLAVRLSICAGIAASLLLIVGKWDRWAALFAWYLWACLFGRNPLVSNPSLPYVGWLLLAHAALPSAPYGSLAAKGRQNPGGLWHMPQSLFFAAWVLLALGYSYSGYTKLVSPSWVDGSAIREVLENPLARPSAIRDLMVSLPPQLLKAITWLTLGLELVFAPLACFRRARPWLWLVMVLMHLGLILLIDFADLSLGMILIHGFTFNPEWIKPVRRGSGKATLFFDGQCGLCHGFVRFVLAESQGHAGIQFAPLHGETFLASVPKPVRDELPDSLVYLGADGEIRTKSRAVAMALIHLGGIWTVLGKALRLLPKGRWT